MATLQQVDPTAAAALQGLVDLLINTPTGEPNYSQIKGLVRDLEGRVSGLTQTVGTTQETRFVNIESTQQQLDQRVVSTEANLANLQVQLQPVLENADRQLGELREYARKSAEDGRSQVTAVIDGAQTRFQEMDQQRSDLIEHARTRFDELEQSFRQNNDGSENKFRDLEQQFKNMIDSARDKFQEIETRNQQYQQLSQQILSMADQDVEAVRARLASQGLSRTGGWGDQSKKISEYKAVTGLERLQKDERMAYKGWVRKLKNAVIQARGQEWKNILDCVERHRVAVDFEEIDTPATL